MTMYTRLFLSFAFCFSFISFSNAQSIAFYADAMVNASEPEHRQYASELFYEMFSADLESSDSFSKTYDDLPWISIQYPEDHSFRIISWQIDLGEGKYNYQGFVQTNDNKNFAIGSKSKRESFDGNDILDVENWSGGLVYKIITTGHDDIKYYALTYRVDDKFTKVKTLEPLVVSDSSVTIGRQEHFGGGSGAGHLSARMALIYSADSNASITYEEESDRLVFDNLITVQGRLPGQGPTQVPDGSYKAFEWKDGGWMYIDKLYTETNEGPLNASQSKKLDKRLFKKG